MKRSKEIIPDDHVLRYYFYFMQERMNIFWRKCEGKEVLTQDPILRKYKFTNVYRACDRVSQYLIRDVIYKDIEFYTPEDVILRVLVFKIFNKIETWEYLRKEYGDITMNHFDVDRISYLLLLRRNNFPVFNNAYMMTGSDRKYDYLKFKHEKWLTMVEKEFIGDGIIYCNNHPSTGERNLLANSFDTTPANCPVIPTVECGVLDRATDRRKATRAITTRYYYGANTK